MSNVHQIKQVSFDEWNIYWKRITHANLLQSWQYGNAKELAEGWKVLRYLLFDIDGHPIALAQILTRTLPFFGGIARLNRGPLLIEQYSESEKEIIVLEAIKILLIEARRRHWWVFQIAPELHNTTEILESLKNLGLLRQPNPAWASGRLNLSVDENSLLMTLNGKWRNCMRKGERLGVEVTHHLTIDSVLNLLIKGYSKLQKSKGFEGLHESLLRNLSKQQDEKWSFNLFIARISNDTPNSEPIGMMVTIRHGDTATYLVGFSNDQGRQMQANSVLLWHSILQSKQSNCVWYDIGGLNVTTPKGIAEFKKGLNAEPYFLVGEFRWYLFPFQFKSE